MTSARSAAPSPRKRPEPTANSGVSGPVDGDAVAPALDNCPFFANPAQSDTDGDGRGNECECGDQSGDGRNSIIDLVAINSAIFNASATPLCDGNGDGLCDVSDIVAANLDSVFYCTRAAAPLLKKQGGAIVNVASIAARKGIPPGSEGSSGPYAVAKAGVMGLTRQLALELGPFGVRVNCVAPGVIASGRLKRVFEITKQNHGPEGPLATIPMGRVGTVNECAALIVALCTDDTSYMTGVTVDINGASYAA